MERRGWWMDDEDGERPCGALEVESGGREGCARDVVRLRVWLMEPEWVRTGGGMGDVEDVDAVREVCPCCEAVEDLRLERSKSFWKRKRSKMGLKPSNKYGRVLGTT